MYSSIDKSLILVFIGVCVSFQVYMKVKASLCKAPPRRKAHSLKRFQVRATHYLPVMFCAFFRDDTKMISIIYWLDWEMFLIRFKRTNNPYLFLSLMIFMFIAGYHNLLIQFTTVLYFLDSSLLFFLCMWQFLVFVWSYDHMIVPMIKHHFKMPWTAGVA